MRAEVALPHRALAFGLDFHPTERLLAAGLITGQIRVYSCADDGASAERRLGAKPHADACRSVKFSPDGGALFSAGSDRSVQRRDLETNRPVWKLRAAHASAVNVCTPLGPHGVGTGDDEGAVRVWDVRQRGAVMRFDEHSDVVHDLHFELPRLQLASCSSDGHLSVYDLRKGRLEARSDELEEELLCLAPLKGGKKLLAGSDSGVLGVFSWGDFGDFSDRLTPAVLGSGEAIEALAPLSEHALLFASADGVLRAASLHPSRMLGEVGRHADPIEALAVDAQGALAATAAHDGTVRLWDVSEAALGRRAARNGGSAEAETEDEAEEAPPQGKRRKGGKGQGAIRLGQDFDFSDL